MNQVLVDHLRPVLIRLLVRRFWLAAAVGWLSLTLLLLVVLLSLRSADHPWAWSRWSLLAGFAAVLGGGLGLACAWTWPRRRDLPWVARTLEKRFGELDACLVTAVEQRPRSDGSYGYLQHEVIRRAIYHSFQTGWQRVVPTWQLAAAVGLGGAGLLAACGLPLAWLYGNPPRLPPSPALQFVDLALDQVPSEFVVDPGNTDIELGTSLLVSARFAGALPARAWLNFVSQTGETGRISMARSLRDPVFAARLNDVRQPLDYSVDIETMVSPTFHVGVFEYPALQRVMARLRFPEFTGLPEKQITDARRLTAVAGTELTWTFELNKPVARAELVDEEGTLQPLQPKSTDPRQWTTQFTLATSRRLELRLVDDQGRTNRAPPSFFVNVVPHKVPQIAVQRPGRDVDASPLEELTLQAQASHEFGGQAAGLTLWVPGVAPREIRLSESWSGSQKKPLQHLLALEELGLAPDQLVSYHFWVEDRTAGGDLRRTTSDLYFIEIRPFDEIFRQGQQPTDEQMRQPSEGEGQSPAGQQAEELATLQKQIITATWNLLRRESPGPPSATYSGDLELIEQSQRSALEQLNGLTAELTDAQSAEVAQQVAGEMEGVLETLQSPAVALRAAALQPAVDAAQAAYQGLLRLRSREHEIVRQQQRGGGGGGGNNANRQAQMQEMELQEDENRYEQERLAETGDSAEARENRQVLNRLRELARRQTDLNERIKELQNALEQSESPAEREEIERRLKRLRDEQQQILQDTDELQERMQSEQNREAMSDSSQQLEEAREALQQSAEALQSNQVSRAAAQGERARDQLDTMRDDFQRRTANQFVDQVEQLQDQAESLQSNQQDVGQQLAELDQAKDESPSLRGADRRSELSNQLRQQAERLNDLTQQVKETIQQAEELEPLLAQALYDTFRQTEQQQGGTRLRSAAESLARGFDQDARAEEAQARQTIEQLREGIEQAAETVVGDQQAALRRANETLDQLAEELRREVRDELGEGEPGPADPDLPDGAGPPDAERVAPKEEPAAEANRNPAASDARTAPLAGERGAPGTAENANPEGQQRNPSAGQDARNPDAGAPQEENQRAGGGGDRSDDPRDLRELDGEPTDPSTDRRGGNRTWAGNPNQRMERDDRGPRNVRPMADDFREWSDRLRDVEEMLNDDALRAEAARVRDNARELRREMRERHSPEPQWDLVQLQVMQPLDQLRRRVKDELIRKSNRRSAVPLDRDPVPVQFQEAVRKYYEQLGSGQ